MALNYFYHTDKTISVEQHIRRVNSEMKILKESSGNTVEQSNDIERRIISLQPAHDEVRENAMPNLTAYIKDSMARGKAK